MQRRKELMDVIQGFDLATQSTLTFSGQNSMGCTHAADFRTSGADFTVVATGLHLLVVDCLWHFGALRSGNQMRTAHLGRNIGGVIRFPAVVHSWLSSVNPLTLRGLGLALISTALQLCIRPERYDFAQS